MSYAFITSATANLLSFSCGTMLTWPSPELDKLRNDSATPFDVPLSNEEASWVSAFLPLGAVFGPFLYGYLSDKIGRKYTVLLIGLPFFLATAILAFATNVVWFYGARFISGLSTGGLFTIMPNYIGEIADSHNRGALSSLLNIFLTAGMLFSYVVGPYVGVKVFNIILIIFPALFGVCFFILGPESAYYYVQNGKHELAKASLQKVRGAGKNVEEELAIMQKKIKEAGKGTFFDIFRAKGLRKAFIISVGLVSFQQFTGINAVLFYAQKIFQDAGVKVEPAVCSIMVGAVQFATSFVTPLVVDRLGRKMLLYVSAIGMVISEVPLAFYGFKIDNGDDVSGIAFLPIACLIAYMITYNFGFGPLPWTVMGELFPNKVKSIASSSTAGICWFLGFLIAKYFESVKDHLGMGPVFLIFTICCGLSVPFIYFVVLETKGKTLHDIQEELES